MKNISKNKIFVKAAFIPHLKKWVFPQPNHKAAKEAYIKQMAQEYYDKGEITKRAYDALMRYEVEITD